MVRLNNWLSPDVLHALGWALVHSLWQCLAVAALAAALMAFLRRPALRYLIAVGALALMLAAPVTTFFLLLTPGANVLDAERRSTDQRQRQRRPQRLTTSFTDRSINGQHA